LKKVAIGESIIKNLKKCFEKKDLKALKRIYKKENSHVLSNKGGIKKDAPSNQ
jgi:hypothetical protein